MADISNVDVSEIKDLYQRLEGVNGMKSLRHYPMPN